MKESTVTIRPLQQPFDATITLPGSKSHANRAIIAACLAHGVTTLTQATPCDDVALLVKNIQKMGYEAEWKHRAAGTLTIHGGKPKVAGNAVLDCELAGTTLRFLTSLAAITPGEWIVTGNERMKKRPIGDLTQALRTLGADIQDTNGFPPLRIRGKQLPGGIVTLDASKSSQFLTSLLLIGPTVENGLSIQTNGVVASPTYVDLTMKVLKDFGVTDMVSSSNHDAYAIPPTPLRSPQTYPIEGDWSAAGAFLVLAELTHSRIRFTNLADDSVQGDRRLPVLIAKLHGKGHRTIDCTDTPDQLMNLAILAAHREGTTTFTGAENLRIKETDRLHVLATELRKVGIGAKETADGIIVERYKTPETRTKNILLNPQRDHRFVMAFAILGSMRPGIAIKNSDCVSKSYPHFLGDLSALHKQSRCIAIVGMRGSGKTRLAEKVRNRLKLAHIDTDAVFVKKYGPIFSFVKKHGWAAFREKEEIIVRDALRPGAVVSLGGGAIESKSTRTLLKQHAVTVWLRTSRAELLKRLQKAKRPALTDLPLHQEIDMILKKRTPLYREVADIELSETLRHSEKVPFILSALKAQCSW